MTALAMGAACVAALATSSVRAEDQQEPAKETVKRLERRVDAVIREMEQLREEVARGRQRPAANDDLRKDVNQLKGQVAEVKEQAAAADAKAEQTGVLAYLGPGLVFEDPRGRWRMQVGGRAQLDYRAYSPDFADANTFSIRRARIAVGATVLDDYYVFVEEEFANQATPPAPNNAPLMTFAFLDLQWFRPGVRFRLGQFKPFFGLDNTQLDMQTDFLERSFTQSLFQNLIYDRGVMVFGEPIPGLFYDAALTNGTGQQVAGQPVDEFQGNLQEAQADGKDYTLRLVGNFAKFFDIQDTVIHLGGTYKRGSAVNSASNAYRAATVQTEARGLTFFIPAPFNSTGGNVSNINRTIVDIEAAYARGPFKIQSDYAQVTYAGTSISPGTPFDFDRDLKAMYVTLGWMLTGEYYSDIYREGTFVRPRPKNNFAWGEKGATGLWELNLRYSWFDGSDFNNANPVNTGRPGTNATSFPNITQGTSKAQAWTLGLKWQPNLYARLALNLIHTKFDTPVVVNGRSTEYENAITTRAQLDF
jgi:phosphate-selective porin OprO/OprP